MSADGVGVELDPTATHRENKSRGTEPVTERLQDGQPPDSRMHTPARESRHTTQSHTSPTSASTPVPVVSDTQRPYDINPALPEEARNRFRVMLDSIATTVFATAEAPIASPGVEHTI